MVVSVTVIDEHLPDFPHDGLAAPQLGQVEGGVVESLKENLRHLAPMFPFLQSSKTATISGLTLIKCFDIRMGLG